MSSARNKLDQLAGLLRYSFWFFTVGSLVFRISTRVIWYTAGEIGNSHENLPGRYSGANPYVYSFKVQIRLWLLRCNAKRGCAMYNYNVMQF